MCTTFIFWFTRYIYIIYKILRITKALFGGFHAKSLYFDFQNSVIKTIKFSDREKEEQAMYRDVMTQNEI